MRKRVDKRSREGRNGELQLIPYQGNFSGGDILERERKESRDELINGAASTGYPWGVGVCVVATLGYDASSFVPSSGRSGGLVLLWKSNRVRVTIIDRDRQFIHTECEAQGKPPFLMTQVYTIPHSNLCSILWSKLKILASGISKPWVVLSDFNDIMATSEGIGGAHSNTTRISSVNNRILECELTDLGFKGPQFTWKGPLNSGFDSILECGLTDLGFRGAMVYLEGASKLWVLTHIRKTRQGFWKQR
ncbi:hypothetical protein K1719_029618 [Acacia pycnantha]|nr:hypothetical protein K1719_029618 [Acacia pycnantha]